MLLAKSMKHLWWVEPNQITQWHTRPPSGFYIRWSPWFSGMKQQSEHKVRWQQPSPTLSSAIKQRVWSRDDGAGTNRECWKLALDQRCRVCVCVCVDVGFSSRLKPVGIREICVQMPKMDIYMSVSQEQNRCSIFKCLLCQSCSDVRGHKSPPVGVSGGPANNNQQAKQG